ncbi:taurine dioxygenase, partial [Pseudomonas syringae pv. tagetis]
MALKAIEGIAGTPRAPYHSISVNRLTRIIGAEVSGVDLSQPTGVEHLEEIRLALLEIHVLVFRVRHMTVEQHKGFG